MQPPICMRPPSVDPRFRREELRDKAFEPRSRSQGERPPPVDPQFRREEYRNTPSVEKSRSQGERPPKVDQKYRCETIRSPAAVDPSILDEVELGKDTIVSPEEIDTPILTGEALWIQFIAVVDPIEFEQIVLQAYRHQGFLTKDTPKTGDWGLDGMLIHDGGRAIGVQIKRYKGIVSTTFMLEFVGALRHHQLTEGIFITTSKVTKRAKLIAAAANIKLVERDQIRAMLFERVIDHIIRIGHQVHDTKTVNPNRAVPKRRTTTRTFS